MADVEHWLLRICQFALKDWIFIDLLYVTELMGSAWVPVYRSSGRGALGSECQYTGYRNSKLLDP